MGDKTIVFREDGKPLISEPLCTGCGICVKKCPFSAIVIVNLAEELREERIHQYGPNGFRVYRLPILKKGAVVGLVGRNGIGKTTVLNILSGSLKPNLGSGDNPPEWDKIIKKFQGTELKNHFEKISLKELAVSIKPQAVYQISEVWKGDGFSLLKQVDERGIIDDMIEQLQLKVLMTFIRD
jgi:ATP-binding cassette subfamily E protein 1